MAVSKKDQRLIINKVFIILGTVAVVVLLVAGSVAWKAYDFATSQVRTGLSEQNIYFPEKGPKFAAADYPTLQKYAGQLVDNGDKAKAYANDYIGEHLTKIAAGKTYAEISTLAMADPTNQALQAQKASLFQGETLRGLLLTAGYSYWTMGMIARDAALVLFAGAALVAVGVAFCAMRVYRQR